MAAGSDTATTQSYVQANYALVSVAGAHLRTSEAAPVKLLAQVRRECPQAAAHSPENANSTVMSNEVIGAMVLEAARPDRQAIETFVRAVSSLRWSNAGLTKAVHAYAGKLRTMLALSTPNLCRESRAWAADGFTTLPAPTTAFVSRFMPAWVALGYVPPRMSAYESSSTRTLASKAARIETLLTEGEARAVPHWGEIMGVLELNP